MREIYNLLFVEVVYNSSIIDDTIQLGVVLGSLNGTEKKRIYLAKSVRKSNFIPTRLYENARKISEENQKMMIKFREYIWERLNIVKTEELDFLIIEKVMVVDGKILINYRIC